MSLTITATSGAPEIDDGAYNAEVLSVAEAKSNNPGWKDQYEIEFAIDGHTQTDGTETTLRAWCSQSLSPKSKLREWAAAILGNEIAFGDEVDTDDFVGKRCRVTVVNKEADGMMRPKIVKVARIRSGVRGMAGLRDEEGAA